VVDKIGDGVRNDFRAPQFHYRGRERGGVGIVKVTREKQPAPGKERGLNSSEERVPHNKKELLTAEQCPN